MDNIFEIENKDRKKVHLSKERWQHIVNEHPNVADTIEDIKDFLILKKEPRNLRTSKFHCRQKLNFFLDFFKN